MKNLLLLTVTSLFLFGCGPHHKNSNPVIQVIVSEKKSDMNVIITKDEEGVTYIAEVSPLEFSQIHLGDQVEVQYNLWLLDYSYSYLDDKGAPTTK